MLRIIVFCCLFLSTAADLDFTLQCQKGYRVTGIRRLKNAYSPLGSLSIECELISEPSLTNCETPTKSPQCNGALEGCTGNTWLGGFRAYMVENSTTATILDPVCCSAPGVVVQPETCINDHINGPKKPFSHSIVSDLMYRGLQCWHQYDAESRLVDLVWKAEICAYTGQKQSTQGQAECPECRCECGIRQCGDGKEPVRVVHKNFSRLPGPGKCSCDCLCTYKCLQ
ncbi:unnamed protein product, partial [Mesorhabditis spiculigera]